MTGCDLLRLRNGEVGRRAEIPVLSVIALHRQVHEAIAGGARLASLFVSPADGGALRLYAILADAQSSELRLACAEIGEEFASLTPECPQAQGFEREIAEQWGVRPLGHPWLKPLRFHAAWRPGHDAWDRPPATDWIKQGCEFLHVAGTEAHEVAVGPVHAGIIEPGHFRFQCHGEEVLHLEFALGYQHRGIERTLTSGPGRRSIHLVETASGDSSVAHALAYGLIMEGLSGASVPARAEALRAVGLELERLANHVGDLGALAGDIGYLPTASYCGRLRGDFLNLTALLCGSRFGRGLIRPGGVGFDLEAARAETLLARFEGALTDLTEAIELLWDTPSVMGRFEDTGALTREDALQLGLVGVAARACGIECDTRTDFPTGIYSFASIVPATWHSGDVFARAFVRWQEIRRSAGFLRELIRDLPRGALCAALGPPAANCVVVSLVEGWRGPVCHAVLTDASGGFATYKIVDPSFLNWPGLALAMRGQQISDFPLCNKSFNLSYCGHDL